MDVDDDDGLCCCHGTNSSSCGCCCCCTTSAWHQKKAPVGWMNDDVLVSSQSCCNFAMVSPLPRQSCDDGAHIRSVVVVVVVRVFGSLRPIVSW